MLKLAAGGGAEVPRRRRPGSGAGRRQACRQVASANGRALAREWCSRALAAEGVEPVGPTSGRQLAPLSFDLLQSWVAEAIGLDLLVGPRGPTPGRGGRDDQVPLQHVHEVVDGLILPERIAPIRIHWVSSDLDLDIPTAHPRGQDLREHGGQRDVPQTVYSSPKSFTSTLCR